MTALNYFGIGFLSTAFILQLAFPKFLSRHKRYLILIAFVGVIGLLFYRSYQQYFSWAANTDAGRFLVPPYQSINYFLVYAGWRFWSKYALSLAAATIFALAARWLNARFQRRFFFQEELTYFFVSLFIAGHPGWLIYLILHLAVYFLINLTATISAKFSLHHSALRLSTYYFWFPLGIAAILILPYLPAEWLNVVKL